MLTINESKREIYGDVSEKCVIQIPCGWTFVPHIKLTPIQEIAVIIRCNAPILFMDKNTDSSFVNEDIRKLNAPQNHYKIHAIKLIRVLADCGLKEAKDAYEMVETMSRNQVEKYGATK